MAEDAKKATDRVHAPVQIGSLFAFFQRNFRARVSQKKGEFLFDVFFFAFCQFHRVARAGQPDSPVRPVRAAGEALFLEEYPVLYEQVCLLLHELEGPNGEREPSLGRARAQLRHEPQSPQGPLSENRGLFRRDAGEDSEEGGRARVADQELSGHFGASDEHGHGPPADHGHTAGAGAELRDPAEAHDESPQQEPESLQSALLEHERRSHFGRKRPAGLAHEKVLRLFRNEVRHGHHDRKLCGVLVLSREKEPGIRPESLQHLHGDPAGASVPGGYLWRAS